MKASERLSDAAWIGSFAAAAKSANSVVVTEERKTNADERMSAMDTRLDLHIVERVDIGRWDHVRLRFVVRDNLPVVAAARCMSGRVIPSVGWNRT